MSQIDDTLLEDKDAKDPIVTSSTNTDEPVVQFDMLYSFLKEKNIITTDAEVKDEDTFLQAIADDVNNRVKQQIKSYEIPSHLQEQQLYNFLDTLDPTDVKAAEAIIIYSLGLKEDDPDVIKDMVASMKTNNKLVERATKAKSDIMATIKSNEDARQKQLQEAIKKNPAIGNYLNINSPINFWNDLNAMLQNPNLIVTLATLIKDVDPKTGTLKSKKDDDKKVNIFQPGTKTKEENVDVNKIFKPIKTAADAKSTQPKQRNLRLG